MISDCEWHWGSWSAAAKTGAEPAVKEFNPEGRMFGMTTPKAKIAVTIDTDVLERVKSAVEAGEARSVSAYAGYDRDI